MQGGENSPFSNPSRKVNTARAPSRNDLCVLCLLFVHPRVFNPGGSKGEGEFISIEWFMVLSLPRKSSAASAYSAVDFFFLL
jgi:hypothetical protein